MPILAAASIADIKRMLELFPVAVLREAWPGIKGTKGDLGFEVAQHGVDDQLLKFLAENIGCCKQHVYIYSYTAKLDAPVELQVPDGERLFDDASNGRARSLYVVRSRYTVILKGPLEETQLEFLWPFCVDFWPNAVVLRLVVLEKDIGSYFDGRSYYVAGRTVEEETILRSLNASLGGRVVPADLHKGIKSLWADGIVDSTKAQYKKPMSTALEAMDESRGIKEYNPELYETLQESPLFSTIFKIQAPPREEFSVDMFSLDPSRGYIAFPRYSVQKGDTEYVIEEILRRND